MSRCFYRPVYFFCLCKTFWKLQKFIPRKKDQFVLIAAIRSLKTKQKLPVHKNKLSQKILRHMIVLLLYRLHFFFGNHMNSINCYLIPYRIFILNVTLISCQECFGRVCSNCTWEDLFSGWAWCNTSWCPCFSWRLWSGKEFVSDS